MEVQFISDSDSNFSNNYPFGKGGTLTLAFEFMINHSKTTNLFIDNFTTNKIIKFHTVGVIGIQIVADTDDVVDNNDCILSKIF